MTANTQNRSSAHRKSTETEQRYLLAESVAPSESASIRTAAYEDGDRTPRAQSPIRSVSTTIPTPYKGFPSEAHYLAALEEWADSKMYLEFDKGLIGFYGPKTMQDIASQPGVQIGVGVRKKWRARKERKAEKQNQRRNTVA